MWIACTTRLHHAMKTQYIGLASRPHQPRGEIYTPGVAAYQYAEYAEYAARIALDVVVDPRRGCDVGGDTAGGHRQYS